MRSPGKAGEGQFLQGDNPFDQGCARNCYITLCALLGPRYMSAAIWMQREEGTEWDSVHVDPVDTLFSP
ncbi:Hypothetical predicted protein [Marmota monax]|uniref:Uncharacterized protein n=1 Tax=Marmota monax TaxID=9995 RepID=A0A5E4CAD8_MARMO|nr:hypothetical protein GHT09_009347 [Marmota monax]VTJ78159.1 Hypothetical predicted protein [Marmota monax]